MTTQCIARGIKRRERNARCWRLFFSSCLSRRLDLGMHRTASYTPSKPEHPHEGSAIVFVSTEKGHEKAGKNARCVYVSVHRFVTRPSINAPNEGARPYNLVRICRELRSQGPFYWSVKTGINFAFVWLGGERDRQHQQTNLFRI